MKKSVWLNYFLICLFLSLFTACSDNNDDEGGTNDDGNVSDKEIVVTMIVENKYYDDLHLEVGFEISGWSEYEYVSQFLQDYKSIPFPKDLVINWGDGTETNSTTHKYAIPGTYQVTLKCKGLQILRIRGNGFTVKEMDLSHVVDLEYLAFERVEISKAFDLSRNKKLKFLRLDSNTPLIDVSKNTALMCLELCYVRGRAIDVDFSRNIELRYLYFDSEYDVSSLNIKGCNELIYLEVRSTLSDEAANQVYRDLPQGKTWTYGVKEYSSYIDLGGRGQFVGDVSIAEQKGWKTYVKL